MSAEAYRLLVETLASRGIDVEKVKAALKRQRIETPSWGYGDSGTRFKVFGQAGSARNTYQKLDDAAQVQRYTGIAPSVALHIPWDRVPDYGELLAYAQSLGLELGAINPNLFQDDTYKLGSLCNPDGEVRRQAVEHILECVEIAEMVGCRSSVCGWPMAPTTRGRTTCAPDGADCSMACKRLMPPCPPPCVI